MKNLISAAFLLSFVASAAHGQDQGDEKPDILTLPTIELGKLLDVRESFGREYAELRFEFENGTIAGIWGNGQASILKVKSGNDRFGVIYDGSGGALVGFSIDWGSGDIPQRDDWFVAEWLSNTKPPAPAILIGLLIDPKLSSVSGHPLLLEFNQEGSLSIHIDLTEAIIGSGGGNDG